MKNKIIPACFELIILENQKIIEKRKINNLVLQVGREQLADLAFGLDLNVFGWVAVGTSNNPPFDIQTDLSGEIARKAFTSVSRSGFTVTASTTFIASEAVGALMEVGIVNNSVGGVFYNRAIFPVINKTGAQTLLINVNMLF
jgi:hypothetical protein